MAISKDTTKRRVQRKQTDIAMDYKKVFGSPEGERVVLDLMKHFHVVNPMVMLRSPTPTRLLEFREGQRSVVLSIIKTVGLNIGKMKELIDRHTNEQENYYGD